MNKERLLLLADFLDGSGKFEGRGAPKEKFHLGHWMAAYDQFSAENNCVSTEAFTDRYDPSSIPFEPVAPVVMPIDVYYQEHPVHDVTGLTEIKPAECKTAGCALGWAATIPEFQRLGLKLVLEERLVGRQDVRCAEIWYKGTLNMNAAMDFFDVTLFEACRLFSPSYYEDPTSPEAVSARIRKFVEGKLDLSMIMPIETAELF